MAIENWETLGIKKDGGRSGQLTYFHTKPCPRLWVRFVLTCCSQTLAPSNLNSWMIHEYPSYHKTPFSWVMFHLDNMPEFVREIPSLLGPKSQMTHFTHHRIVIRTIYNRPRANP